MINKNGGANKPLLYLDVDGIILGKSNPDDPEIVVAKGAVRFLETCIKYFDCYWLSTHCKDGDIRGLINMLRQYGNDELIEVASKIKPAKWTTMKTEAIDPKSDFFWIDDDPLACEVAELEKHGVSDCLVSFSTREDPDALVTLAKLIVWNFEMQAQCNLIYEMKRRGEGGIRREGA